jgi:hypothetical protein
MYQTQSAVLFIVFNRPETTGLVFERIKAAQPRHLYIAADGPRTDRAGEAELCAQTRAVAQLVDWPCQVNTLYRDTNLGCKEAVSSAITWFFEHEEEGIILEDDCLPAHSFFKYCDTLLEKYRYDTRIRHIGGANLQQGNIRGNASYYYSNLTHVWGWAGWRRVWQEYDKDLTKYHTADVRLQMSRIFTDTYILDSWVEIFTALKAGRIDTWDYQLTFLNFFNHSLSVIPNQNLISNIGFGNGSTHTVDTSNRHAAIPLQEMDEITHPIYVLPSQEADLFTLNYDFNVAARRKKHDAPRRKVKRWFKGLFKKSS